mmetsp:Transcript_34000/g.33548  ORF Transcript_34000/g.33548 Transcript_34000/m.33548 type:complete len:124 (+) Transcript_34000:1306-1677(+)|eukprot:CAMPEP_0196997304 /NCGR_PEP_ID=MMETSP1380-20130617/2951_1 /TAXON_ID=5936 /ORGANISM="Euplotes crassus, Strain CT5" /LENGTH=123 /DNA_ID=CAMNT_0042413497 /DNA_START=1289 /DNA_END=1660 /DNA_ORIENTATION=+
MVEYMEKRKHKSEYNIMLVITNEPVADMEKTITEINKASNLPMSILIIGLGDKDFQKLEMLKTEITPEGSSSRETAKFWKFNRSKDRLGELTEKVLSGIPEQIVEYMSLNRIEPKIVQHDNVQ